MIVPLKSTKEKKGSSRAYIIYAVDFDGTLCENLYPAIGEPNRALIDYLKKQQSVGDKLILWTCRDGMDLKMAVGWCREQGLVFNAVNDNLPDIKKAYGTNPRKITADVYIDDRNWKAIRFRLPYRRMK